MSNDKHISEKWKHYNDAAWASTKLDLTLDVSRMDLPENLFKELAPKLQEAFDAMADLESGGLANPDEQRMVGHYWLRNPELAPSAEIKDAIVKARKDVADFVGQVHFGSLRSPGGKPFRNLILMGIGGSILGPQLLQSALSGPNDKMRLWTMDNTDPDGVYRVLRRLHHELDRTLCVVTSKSGGTMETLNAMEETRAAMTRVGLKFPKQAVAVTMPGSKLDERAKSEGWLASFPVWEWVGGRTSLFSPVGLLPAALLGLDVDALVQGAARMDEVTRVREVRDNPAAILAAAWYDATERRGLREMVIEPYKDRLEPWSRYVQQLMMESLGKTRKEGNEVVSTGMTVYGNKGSTDQHSVLQHLCEGPGGFFVTFVHVMRDLCGATWASGGAFDIEVQVQPEITSGDCLLALLLGTRSALHAKSRPSLSIFVDRLDAMALGELVALYERAVGLYATMVGINAYNQPGVEESKRRAGEALEVQRKVLAALKARQPEPATAAQIAMEADLVGWEETVYLILRHLSSNPTRGVRRNKASRPADETYFWERGN